MKMHSFREYLLDREDFVSGMSFVPFYNDFEHEKTGNPYSKMFLTRTFLFANRFSKFLLHNLRQTRCSLVPRKYFFYIRKISAKVHYTYHINAQ